MAIVIDTSVIVAVILNEPAKPRLLQVTAGKELVGPASLQWEVENAFSAMFKRKRLSHSEAIAAWELFEQMSLRIEPVSVRAALGLCESLGIYAYDAYMIECARREAADLLTLDGGLRHAAGRAGIVTIEVEP